jgi:hypothetical protein
MEAPDGSRGSRFMTLPDGLRPDDLVAGVDTGHSPEPEDVRNVDQHAATRDD